ncbi:MAG: hypothetical protein C4530_17110 [Desulfobacteraceae bacterium]|nr:MAG: hypothetical protein C4530_17110 [Desulfobacteraceae bacterium]
MGQKFYQKASVQVVMVTGIVAIVIAAGQIWFAHSNVKVENRKLNRDIQILRDDLAKSNGEVQRLETLLTPFRTIALERYAGPEGEALRKLASKIAEIESQIETTKRLAEPAVLILDGVDIKPVTEGFEAIVKFRPSKNQPVPKITITAQLPVASQARILELKQVPPAGGTLAVFNVRKGINPDGKAAMWQCNPSGIGPAWFSLTVSQPTKALIELDCGPKPFEIDIQTQNKSVQATP